MFQDIPHSSDKPVWDLWLSCFWLPAFCVADDTGLFAALAESPADSPELATRLDLNPRAVRALLPLLASLGLLVGRGGRYCITELTRNYLLPGSPCDWRPVIDVYKTRLPYYHELSALLTGGSAADSPAESERRRPGEAWAEGKVDAPMAERVAPFMHAHSFTAAAGVARAAAWNDRRRLLDVGGGSGCFSIAVAERNPHLECTVMELPAMCAQAERYISAAGLQGRIDTVAVDMFRDPWPLDYDAVFFSNVFHDWDTVTCRKLASRAYEILPPDGRIVLHEMLFDDHGDGPCAAATFSLLMLLGTEGQQFSFDELREILEAAGFCDVTATSTHAYYSLVQGTRPPDEPCL